MQNQSRDTTVLVLLDHLFRECLRQKQLESEPAIIRAHRCSQLRRHLHQMRAELVQAENIEQL